MDHAVLGVADSLGCISKGSGPVVSCPRSANDGGELVTLFAALAGDAILVLMTLEEGMEYFEKIVRIEGSVSAVLWIGGWIAIWLGWQLIALLNLVRPLARRVV